MRGIPDILATQWTAVPALEGIVAHADQNWRWLAPSVGALLVSNPLKNQPVQWLLFLSENSPICLEPVPALEGIVADADQKWRCTSTFAC